MRWVVQTQHRFSHDVEEREEGGTPNILGVIRAAVPMQARVLELLCLETHGMLLVIFDHVCMQMCACA